MRKFLLKTLLPLVAQVIEIDISTVQKTDGNFLKVTVEILGRVILNHHIKLSGTYNGDLPIDFFVDQKGIFPGSKGSL